MTTPQPGAEVRALVDKTEQLFMRIDGLVGGRETAETMRGIRQLAREGREAAMTVGSRLQDADARVQEEVADAVKGYRKSFDRPLYPSAADIPTMLAGVEAAADGFWPIFDAFAPQLGSTVTVTGDGVDTPVNYEAQMLSGTALRDQFFASDPDAADATLAFRQALAEATGRRL